jgi:hypothetical protein
MKLSSTSLLLALLLCTPCLVACGQQLTAGGAAGERARSVTGVTCSWLLRAATA